MHSVNDCGGLRERKKRETREALVDAAQALVRADGLDHLTVEAISQRARVSTRTFFNYFESKVDAVLGIEPWHLDDRAVETFAAGGPTGHLSDDTAVFVASVLRAHAVGRNRTRTAMDLARTEPRLLARQVAWMEAHRASVGSLVERRLAEHPSPARPDAIAVLIFMLVRASLTRWEEQGGMGSPADHVVAVLAELRALLDPADPVPSAATRGPAVERL
jgi:AcrR family transcriptional regulator